MKKYLIILLYTLLYVVPMQAQSPKWLKKVRGAQVAVMVYSKNGDMKETQGVFSDEKGTVLTEYDALKHAIRAVVVDATGKEYPVKEVSGANAMYNVAKYKFVQAAFKEVYKLPDVKKDAAVAVSGGFFDYFVYSADAKLWWPMKLDIFEKLKKGNNYLGDGQFG